MTSHPILCQLLLQFVAIVNNPDWVQLIESVSQRPLLYWYCYSYLKRVFNCFANFATNFNNGNIMSENRPITELNTLTLVRALTVMKTFCQQINLHQAQLISIMVMPATVSVTLQMSLQQERLGSLLRADKMDKLWLQQPKSHPMSGPPPTTIDIAISVTPAHPAQTKANRPCKASEMRRETILAIASHFKKKDIGWFNEYHFMKMPQMIAEVKRLLGNTKGVMSKTA
jgi:hypothetical protein